MNVIAWLLACSRSAPATDPGTSSGASTPTAETGAPADCGWREVDGSYIEALDACLWDRDWIPANHRTFVDHVLTTAPRDGYPAWNNLGPAVEQYVVRRCPADDGASYDQVYQERWDVDDGSAWWSLFDVTTGAMVGDGSRYLHLYADDYHCCEGSWASAELDGTAVVLDCSDPDYYWPEDFGLR